MEAVEWGDGISVEVIWDAIESRVSRAELRTAVANLAQMTPPPEADPHGEWRAKLVNRYKVMARLVPLLVKTIRLEAAAEQRRVLYAVQGLPELKAARATKQVPTGFLDARHASVDVVPPGWWRPLVFAPGRPEGTVDRAAYVFCVLELSTRGSSAAISSRWSRRGGQTRVRSCSPGRRGRRPPDRCWTCCACRSSRTGCSTPTPASWTRHGVMSPPGWPRRLTPMRRSVSTPTGGCTPRRSRRCRIRRA